MATRWSSDDLAVVYERLLAAKIRFVVVGGQAINLWAEHYRASTGEAAWEALAPFTSPNLDLFNSRIDVAAVGEILQLKHVLEPFVPKADNLRYGTLTFPMDDGRELAIHFRRYCFEAGIGQTRDTAQELVWKEQVLRVMHPALCFYSAMGCALKFPQPGRQDVKHVRTCLLILREFFGEHFPSKKDLQSLASILDRTADKGGLRIWHEYGIRCEECLPLAMLQEPAFPKLEKFMNQLALRRQHFAEIATRRGEQNAP